MNEIVKRICSINSQLDKMEVFKANAFVNWYEDKKILPKKSDLKIEIFFCLPDEDNYLEEIKEDILESDPWTIETKLTIWTLRRLKLWNYVFSELESNRIRKKLKEHIIAKDKEMIDLYGFR